MSAGPGPTALRLGRSSVTRTSSQPDGREGEPPPHLPGEGGGEGEETGGRRGGGRRVGGGRREEETGGDR